MSSPIISLDGYWGEWLKELVRKVKAEKAAEEAAEQEKG